MSHRRSLSWSAALRDLRDDRTRLAPGVLSAKSYTQTIAGLRKLSFVTASGAYDRAAIMTLAVVAARAHQARTGEAWGVCMSAALKGTWMAAKAARRAVAH